jgi:hypothetical protein
MDVDLGRKELIFVTHDFVTGDGVNEWNKRIVCVFSKRRVFDSFFLYCGLFFTTVEKTFALRCSRTCWQMNFSPSESSIGTFHCIDVDVLVGFMSQTLSPSLLVSSC